MNPDTKANLIVCALMIGLFIWGCINGFNDGRDKKK